MYDGEKNKNHFFPLIYQNNWKWNISADNVTVQ